MDKINVKAIHAIVTGKVQGVFYRKETQKKAKSLNLLGWVRNLSDGRVELVAQGDEALIDELIAWLYKGPVMARVDSVEILDEPIGTFDDFLIISTK